MSKRPFFGLAGRLGLYAALLIVLAAGGIAVRLSLHEAELAHASLRNLGLSTVQTASGLAELGLASGNPEEMQRVADTIGAFPGVVSVELFDVSGRSRARVPHLSGSAQPRVLALPRPDAPTVTEPGAGAVRPDVLEFVAPVRIGPRLALPGDSDAEADAWPVGYVALSLGTHAVSERVRQFIRSSMTTAAVMVALGCAGMAAISWRTVRPLRRLTHAAAAVADGNLDTTVQVRSRDEVGQLSVAFNRMTERLRAMHAGLIESQQQLEARVEERTRSLQQATAAAWRLAKHDVLTGLPNRAYLAERLEASVARAGERGRQVAVLFVDLDNFKTINDSLGHPVGDRMLRAVSQRLVASAGDDGFVARLSGDEFVMVHDIGEARHAPTDLVALAARLLRLLAEPVRQPDGRELTLGASIGIALYPDDALDATGLLRAADTAMYAAKRNGRMNYQFFDAQMDAEAHERLQVESALRQAFVRGEFELWYQPQFAAATGELVGAEALLRWNHPERGLVSPAAFIQIAEQNGMIRQIGAWVLQTAAHQCKAWSARAASPLRVAVNVSPHQLNRSNLVETVEAALRAADLPAHLLELELTESGIIEDPERGLALLARLRALGVRLSIDDFGTGYSSFSHLTRLPVQTVKVDRSFVQGLPGSRSDAAVAEAICAMAKKLGLRTLAEGVETPEQLAALARMGYDEVQGYLLGRPIPAAAFEAAYLTVRDARAAAGAYA